MDIKKAVNETPKVIVKKVIQASRERVFDAWIKPELMKEWFVGKKGKSVPSNDLRIGGSYLNDMHIENDKGEITIYKHHGEYLEIVPPERLVFTWNSPFVQNTKVTVELKELNGATEITLTHELLPSEEQCESHYGGWNFALGSLTQFIEN